MINDLVYLTGMTCIPDEYGKCSICADDGIPGTVLTLRPNNMAILVMPTGNQEVAIDLVENVQIGDYLLVHLGFAIAKLETLGNLSGIEF